MTLLRKNKLNKTVKYGQRGGMVIDIPPIDTSKLGPVEILHIIITKSLTIFISNLIRGKSPAEAQAIVNQILDEDTIQFRINTIANKISSQINLSILMAVNAAISFIPVPIIPGLIRDANNGIYQIVKVVHKAQEYDTVKNDVINKLKATGIEIDDPFSLSNLDPLTLAKDALRKTQKNVKSIMSKISVVGKDFSKIAKDATKIKTETEKDFKQIENTTKGDLSQNITNTLQTSEQAIKDSPIKTAANVQRAASKFKSKSKKGGRKYKRTKKK